MRARRNSNDCCVSWSARTLLYFCIIGHTMERGIAWGVVDVIVVEIICSTTFPRGVFCRKTRLSLR